MLSKRQPLQRALSVGVVLLFFGVISIPAQVLQPARQAQRAELLNGLLAQGISLDQIMDTDARGVPVLCGTKPPEDPSLKPQAAPLPIGARGWEVIPCVIRPNGVDTFRLEVNVNTNVTVVTLQCNPTCVPESGGATQVLRDDGQGGDRVAGDRIWTSVPLRYDTSWPVPQYFAYDTNSPAGLSYTDVGSIKIKELTGETNEFLVTPQVGLLIASIPVTPARTLATNVQVSPHVVNVQGTNQAAQKFLRGLNSAMEGVTKMVYSVVPDAFDFLMFFSSDHLEKVPRLASDNFNAGIHGTVKVSYSGTGQGKYDSSAWYGSHGQLQSINVLDTASRGTYSGNSTHELLHQWLVFTSPSLRLDDGTAHYNYRAGAASLLGGVQFVESTNGGVILNCDEGRSRAHYAPPLDLYMMGLIEASNVPPIRIYNTNLPGPYLLCSQYIDPTNLVEPVTIEQILQAHGVRTPGPATAQRDFTIGFIVESSGRLLNPVELTFYEILAKHYTKRLPASAPAPEILQNWAPVTKFFGDGVTWRAYVREFVQSRIDSITRVEGGAIALAGTGFPKASYTLQGSTNLLNWSTLAEVTPDTNGALSSTNPLMPGAQFYRVMWNE